MTGVLCMLAAGGAGPLALELGGGFGAVSGSSPVATTCTANPTGGAGPYTYLWTWDSNPHPITLTNATSKTCNVSAVLGPDESAGGTIRCTVTDSASVVVDDTASVGLTRTP